MSAGNNLIENISAKQNEYISLIAEIMEIRKRGEKPLAYIRTYGCQQNVADSEKIKGMLANAGFGFVDAPDDADFILFNTCAVREHAEDRVFGNVGALKALKRRHPQILIALCGCMMEQEHIANRIYKSFPFVGLVFGTHSLHHFPELVYNALVNGKRIFERGNDDNKLYEGMPVKRDGTFKGWLPIMYGCNNFCTYCIVPYVRGRERSREKNVIVSEAREMIADGYKDITLLGQNVNSYGKTIENGVNFSQLLKEIDSIDGDYWLRFMTSHPKDCSKELIDTIADGTHISRHLHLPFQSGSDRILKAMNRHYDTTEYANIVDNLRKAFKNASMTTDVMVGFAGESKEDFKASMSFVEQIGFAKVHVFPYSQREGTVAANAPDQVSPKEKEQRAKLMGELVEKTRKEFLCTQVGLVESVLVERFRHGYLEGYTKNYTPIHIMSEKSNLCGQIVNVKIIKSFDDFCEGELV